MTPLGLLAWTGAAAGAVVALGLAVAIAIVVVRAAREQK